MLKVGVVSMIVFSRKDALNRQLSISAFPRTKNFDLTPKTLEDMNFQKLGTFFFPFLSLRQSIRDGLLKSAVY